MQKVIESVLLSVDKSIDSMHLMSHFSLLLKQSMKSSLVTAVILLVALTVNDRLVSQEITVSEKKLPLAGEAFQINGLDAFLIEPKTTQSETPWVWYAPTLKNLPGKEEIWMFERFLNAGIAIAGIDVGESYGSPKGTDQYSVFYEYLTNQRGLSKRPVLLARSRGGLMLYNWGIENPNQVAAIAGIYPVCNLASYPGIEKAKDAYGLNAAQLSENLSKFNPIERLSSLAKHRVPILHLHGDQDRVVPLEDNSAIIQKRYSELGGNMHLKLMEGQGHNMWQGWFQDPTLTDFVIHHAQIENQQSSPDRVSNPKQDLWLHFKGKDGPGKNKKIVFVAAEQEYRSEQSLPMMAKLLASRHGFDCTVLFSVNPDGKVDPTLPAPFKEKSKHHFIPGLELLANADCVVWMSRFMQLPEEQLAYFYEYFDSGKPLVALRTANHGFWGVKPYQVNEQNISLRELLGGAFMSHHGGWHREATIGIPVLDKKSHPILSGVTDIWGTSDVYRCHAEDKGLPNDCTALVMGQPAQSLDADAPPNTDKVPLPIAWTKTWIGNKNLESKIFHFTMGSAEDFANEGVRRIVVNSIYWGLDLSEQIDPTRSVEPIDPYLPMKSGFNYEALGVTPRSVDYYQIP